jgi:hypothetical protein
MHISTCCLNRSSQLSSPCRISGSFAVFHQSANHVRGHLSELTLQKQNAENLKQIFPEKEYRGLSPNFHIHVSVSELYIPTMGLPFLLEEICGPILGIYKSPTDT